MKPTILMLPSWYPTKENPLSGSFFKEQAEVLSEKYSFIILHTTSSNMKLLKYYTNKLFDKRKSTTILSDFSTNNLPEYTIHYIYPNDNHFVLRMIRRIGITFIDKKIKQEKLRQQQKALQLLKQAIPLPILVYAMTAQIIAVSAQKIANFFDVPYVLAEHCPFPLVGTTISDETKKAIEDSDSLISISNDKTRQMLMQNIDCHPILVGNMINENLYSLPSENTKKIFNILIVAAYNFYKDYATFLSAMKLLTTLTSKNFKITIIGYSPSDKNNTWSKGKEEFEQLVKAYGLWDISTLIPSVPRLEIIKYYQSADLFIMTSIQEGLPVSSLEASACGLPVFATRCGGVEDFIDDKCGRLFNLQDYKSIAYAIKDFMEGKISFDANYIRQNIISKYGIKVFREKMYSIFESASEKGTNK